MNDKMCDCLQGRLPCTCKDSLAQLCAASACSERRRISDQYVSALRYVNAPMTECPTDGAIERFSLEARLQFMQGLALLGWTAAILLALGV